MINNINAMKSIRIKLTKRPMLNKAKNLALMSYCVTLLACSPQKTKPDAYSSTQATAQAAADSIENSSLSISTQQEYFEALTAINNDNLDLAINTLERLHRIQPAHMQSHLNLAIAHFKKGNFDKANIYATELESSKVSNAALENLLGLIAVEKKAYVKAKKHYLAAIGLNKNYPEPYYNLALLNDIFFQDIATAYTYYQQYIELVPSDNKTKSWANELKFSLEN
jgi:Flp pilus assembly protein TadD